MKRQRHRMILEIIENQAIETQEALSEALRKYGFDVTQATVSRDIKELRLFKVMGDDGVFAFGRGAGRYAQCGLHRDFARMPAYVFGAADGRFGRVGGGGAPAAAQRRRNRNGLHRRRGGRYDGSGGRKGEPGAGAPAVRAV